jgi:2-polyprenyl-3-methyl-5-hydroxy-6-metoxy-1,4-benzoquinol methylase
MHLRLLDVLGCPRCHRELTCVSETRDSAGEIQTGTLRCGACPASYPITSGIPRFVPNDVYASSFGYQWNRFRTEQLDSVNGTTLSRDRLYSETGWSKDWMRSKWVLDAGCGAGRFLDVVAESGAEVVGLDISSAIDAARDNLNKRPHVHFVQASLYEMPFRDRVFDGVYCIGVIQHTPDPLASVRALPRVLKDGGRIAYTIYEKRRFTPLYSKYLVRPLTTKLGQRALLGAIRGAMPVLFPVTEVAFRIPVVGRALRFAIPIANYVHERQLTVRQRYAWAVLDTFDMLAPRYDQPQTEADVVAAMRAAGVDEICRTPAGGLNLVGRKIAR